MNDATARFEEDLRRDLRRLADRAGEGPTPEQVLSRLRSRPLSARAPVLTSRLPRLAAAVITAGLIGVALIWLALQNGPGIAWADVRDEILSAQTASWSVRIEFEGQEPVTWRVFFKEPGLMRQEMLGGLVAIVDVSKGVCIVLDSKRKTATVMDMKDFLSEAVAGKGQNLSLAWFKERVRGGHEELGEKDIGGIRVIGFRLRLRGITTGVMDIWVDPVTGYIVRSDFEEVEHGFRMTTTDFELNPTLDDALFSTEVPEGYEVEASGIDFGGAGEEDLLEGLRYLAKYNKGVFPKVLLDPLSMPSRRQMEQDMAAIDRQMAVTDREIADQTADVKKREAEWEKIKEEVRGILEQADTTEIEKRVEQVKEDVTKADRSDQSTPPETAPASRPAERPPSIFEEMIDTEMRFIMAVAAITMKSDEMEYFGGGVKLGDAATPIMWWRIKGAKTYRVVYGDLSVKDIQPSDLPAPPPAPEGYPLGSKGPATQMAGKPTSFVAALTRGRHEPWSRSNLRQIGLAITVYCSDNRGRGPKSLEELVAGGYLSPERKDVLRDPTVPGHLREGKTDYVLRKEVADGSLKISASPGEPIVWSDPTKVEETLSVLYSDGAVMSFKLSELPPPLDPDNGKVKQWPELVKALQRR